MCSTCFIGVNLKEAVDLRKAVADWCAMISNKGIPEDKKDKLKVHIFECHYEDFETDVEISEVKKK